MIIGGYQPFTLSDFPGHIAAIVFTQGCNWRCEYCHNRSLMKRQRPEISLIPEAYVLDSLRQRQAELDGIVITGGEPTIQEDLPRFMRKVRHLGLAIKLDTNGSRPEVIQHLIEEQLLDYIAMDIKAPFERYEAVVRRPVNTDALQRSIDLIKNSGLPHEFRTPLVLESQWETEPRNEDAPAPDSLSHESVILPQRKLA